MKNEQPKWKSINTGDILPCQSFLRKKDGEILKLSTTGGVTVGQDCYYLPVDEVINVIKDYPVEESKDERIRKAIYNCVKWFGFDSSFFKDVSQEECLAYIEKQGEKKHQYNSRPRYVGEGELLGKKATKIEPKFKVGDWVVCKVSPKFTAFKTGDVIQISNKETLKLFLMFEDCFRLWDITKDAKDGDVLVASDGSIFLFKETVDNACKHYVAFTSYHDVKFNEGLEHYWETIMAVHPATKEQRDLLFQGIKEAGYEWDAEKKELKQIEHKPIKHNNDATIDSNLNDYCCKVYNALHKENGGNLSFERLQHLAMDIYKWCKEQHTHAEWSKEDEFHFKSIESTIEYCKKEVAENDDARYNEDLNWFKSLKDRVQSQSTWKPSKEQMDVLKEAIEFLGCTKTRREQLQSLYEQLKKLREE